MGIEVLSFERTQPTDGIDKFVESAITIGLSVNTEYREFTFSSGKMGVDSIRKAYEEIVGMIGTKPDNARIRIELPKNGDAQVPVTFSVFKDGVEYKSSRARYDLVEAGAYALVEALNNMQNRKPDSESKSAFGLGHNLPNLTTHPPSEMHHTPGELGYGHGV